MSEITIGFAFFAGLASFLSPCVLALMPAYVSYLSGKTLSISPENSIQKTNSMVTLRHGLAFVIGFSIVFVGLGSLAGALGAVLVKATSIMTKLGGAIVVIFGLHTLKVINIPFLNYDLRGQISDDRDFGYVTSGLMGVFFSAGWAPCIGPILGAILTLSFNGGSISEGAWLLTAYSAGLAIPFLLAATQISWVTTILRRYKNLILIVEKIVGTLLIGLGLLLFSGRFSILASLGAFFNLADEIILGQLILLAVIVSMLIAFIIALIAKRIGKSFIDYLFLSAGGVLVLFAVLYMMGVFDTLILYLG